MAREFSGTSQVVFVQGAQGQLNDLTEFTWCAWVYKDTTSSDHRVMAKHSGVTGQGKNLYVDSLIVANGMRASINRATTNASAVSSSNTVPLGQWRFVVLTYESTDGPRLYVGSKTSSVAEVSYSSRGAGSGAETSDSGVELCLGARNNSGGSGLDGRLADARVYSRRLTVQEMESVKIGGHARGLRGWWPLWGTQTTEPDWSGNNNHATVTGATKVDHPPGVSALWVRPESRVQVAHTVGGPVTTTKQIAGKANIFNQTTETKFYASNVDLGESEYLQHHGVWDYTPYLNTNRKSLRRYPVGVTATATALAQSTNANFDVGILRWVSEPIKAYTFSASDTVEWVLGVYGETNANAVFHVHILVYQGDTETARGTLLQDFIGSTTWTPFAQGRTEGLAPLQSVAAQNGDRIGIEIGVRVNATSSLRLSRLYYGGAGGTESAAIIELGASPVPLDEVIPDLTDGSPSVTTERGWFQFVTSAPLFTSADQTITGRARIHATVDREITGVANIFQTGTLRTITGKAAIKKTTDVTITGKGHIIFDVSPSSQDIQGKAAIKRTTDRTIAGISNIQTSTQAARTIQGRTSVLKSISQTIQGKANIKVENLVAIDGVSRVHATVSRTITGRARIAVLGETLQEIQGRARITAQPERSITGTARLLVPSVTRRTKVKLERP